MDLGGFLSRVPLFDQGHLESLQGFPPDIGDQNCHFLGYGVEPSSCFYEKVHRVKLKYGSTHLEKIGAKDRVTSLLRLLPNTFRAADVPVTSSCENKTTIDTSKPYTGAMRGIVHEPQVNIGADQKFSPVDVFKQEKKRDKPWDFNRLIKRQTAPLPSLQNGQVTKSNRIYTLREFPERFAKR
ncbi:hypothetical protein JHK86_010318 [Glycine max]|nr:hypothetical protein JHK86_010318 [Glycine max]